MRRFLLSLSLTFVALASIVFAGARGWANAQTDTESADGTPMVGESSSATVQLQHPDGSEAGQATVTELGDQIRIEFNGLNLEFAEYSIHVAPDGDCASLGSSVVSEQATPVAGVIPIGRFVAAELPGTPEATIQAGADTIVVLDDSADVDVLGSAILVLTKVGGTEISVCGALEPASGVVGATPDTGEVIATVLATALPEDSTPES